MKEAEKSLDPQLWLACAGGMVQIPQVNSLVYYFPQGHAEHASANVDFAASLRIPALILCRVVAVKFLADNETDEVYAKMKLIPLGNLDVNYDGDLMGDSGSENADKPASFAKTLTQSDANNGGGFSVPRYCAETIFSRLDYTADPPTQTLLAKDVHGEIWKFRHIYRGTPRRHLLTTGWSTFVNHKKLVAGDSIVFLRAENGDLCVGIRRAKRSIGCGLDSPSGWNGNHRNCVGPYGALDDKLLRNGYGNSGLMGRGKLRPESVLEAASLAVNGQSFEVVYYPRASTPEFCNKAASVRAAMRIHWYSGMRFKMPFETEDSSRISWFMGTIASAQVVDPIRWPNSPWRLLQVTWDEPDLLQNVKRVSPWLVELIADMPVLNLAPFPSRKKLRLPQHSDFSLDQQFRVPPLSGNPLGPINPINPMCYLTDNAPVGIQGARHVQFGISLSDLHLCKKQQMTLLPPSFQQLHMHLRYSDLNTTGDAKRNDSVSNLSKVGNSPKKSDRIKKHQFLLFGQTILLEQEINPSCSSDADIENENVEEKKSSTAEFVGELGLDDTGHCKVFLESEDLGRTLDLSLFSSYDELYMRLASMFEIERTEISRRVLYRDSNCAVKQAGDEPYSEFVKKAKRLTILTGSGSKDIRGTWITGLSNVEPGLGPSNKAGYRMIMWGVEKQMMPDVNEVGL